MPPEHTHSPALAHDPGGRSRPKWPSDSVVTAEFSPCGVYRYSLVETWERWLPRVMWLLMNPSAAGLEHADPTLRKTGAYARKWGYGSQVIGNVHAYRATDARRLLAVADPGGPDNYSALTRMAALSQKIILAFGQPPARLRPRAWQVVKLLLDAGAGPKLSYLRLAKDGTPCHPLYLPGDLLPQPWSAPPFLRAWRGQRCE